jgi:hypothetical protein
MSAQEAADHRSADRRRRIVLNVAIFLALVIVAFAGRELVALEFNHKHRDFGYALGEIAYALVFVAPVALVLLVPGLLLVEEAASRLPRGVVRAFALPLAALAFAPFIGVTGGGAEIIPIGLGAIAYPALLRLPSARRREHATSGGAAGGSASAR